MKKLFIVFLLLKFCSCNNVPQQQNEMGGETIHSNAGDTIITNARPVMLAGCYKMVSKKDTAILQLSVLDSTVSGTLNYKWYEKDNNSGSIKGVIRDSLIVADYIFQSEGILSTREIVFKIFPERLIQGIGKMEEKNSKQIFMDEPIKFDTSLSFYKTLCR